MATNEGQARESSLTTEGVVQPERFMNPLKLIDELEKKGFYFNDPKDPEYVCELYEDFTKRTMRTRSSRTFTHGYAPRD
jgi:hypothetical protein